MKEAVKIVIPAWSASLWRAVESSIGAPVPLPQVDGMAKAMRQSAFKKFVELGVIRIVEKGVGRRPATIEVLVDEVEIGKAGRAGKRAAAPLMLAAPSRPPAVRVSVPAAVVSEPEDPGVSPIVSGIEAAIHGMVAEVVGGFARVAEVLGGGLRQIRGGAEGLTQAIAAPAGADQLAQLEHQVEGLKAVAAQALRDRDAALSIAGRARVDAMKRETPIELAVRKIRQHGDSVTRGAKGVWLVNGSKIGRADAWMIERASKLDQPAPEA